MFVLLSGRNVIWRVCNRLYYIDKKLPPFRSFGLSVSISTKSGLLEPFLFWPDELDDPLLLLTPRYTIFYIRSKKMHNTSKDLLEMLFLIQYIHDGSWMT